MDDHIIVDSSLVALLTQEEHVDGVLEKE